MTQEDYYNKLSFGMITTLFDRYTNNLTWLNIPLILYNVVVHTIKYLPFLSEDILRLTILAFVGFFVGAVVVMYIDYKYIFQSERQFMYNKMEYFENHYNEVRDLIREKREIVLRNRQVAVQ